MQTNKILKLYKTARKFNLKERFNQAFAILHNSS